MDGQRFDQFARLFGSGASRRRVIKGLFAGAAGVAVSRYSAKAECLPLEDGVCSLDEECCDGSSCFAQLCRQDCVTVEDCTQDDSHQCLEGLCLIPSEPCTVEFDACDSSEDCCDDLECSQGVCTDTSDCEIIGGGACGVDEDCCGTLRCETGACVEGCVGDGDPCDEGAFCCGGSTCVEGACVADPECVVDGDCTAGQGLGGAAICCDGSCEAKECCGELDDDRCDFDEICNSDGFCVENTPECTVDDDCVLAGGEPLDPAICCDGTCVVQDCCGEGDDGRCDEGDVCLEGFVCGAEPVVCGEFDDPCDGEEDCCGDLICTHNNSDNVCVECIDDSDCDDDLVCHEGHCVADPDECEDDSDCVIQVSDDSTTPICCGGVCVQNQCCTDDEDPNARCPEGTSCFEGVCDPVEDQDDDDEDDVSELPNTGAGNSGGLSSLLGAGLAAGAAAFIAGKKLRNQPSTNE